MYEKLLNDLRQKLAEYEGAFNRARDMAQANAGAMEATKDAIARIERAMDDENLSE